MNPLVQMRQKELETLCRNFRVRRLDLFGSAATGEFDPQASDLDFVVEFQELDPNTYADAYFGLREALERLFGRDVDLVMKSAVTNPYFLDSIDSTKSLLYAA